MDERDNALMSKRRTFRHRTIAIVYDFDGTLTPHPMQEYTILPKIRLNPATFWAKVKREVATHGGDQMLTYMRLLVEEIERNQEHLDRADLRALGKKIKYFPGVDTWFDRIAKYVAKHGDGIVKLESYILSAGQKEILDGIKYRKHFKRIFASEYHFDHHGRATFPKILINDTIKTQYLFRINKGLDAPINEYMPEHDRRIPFQNIIYLGDGMTDVPGMTVTKKNGGYAIAIHKPRNRRSIAICKKLLKAGRVDFYAPGDYSAGHVLESRVQLLLDKIIAHIHYERELFRARLAV